MAQLAEIATGDTAASASVPYREVSAQEWMQVPRTLPDSIVILGTWGPLLVLLIWLFRIQGAEVPAAGSGWWSLLLGLVAVIALGYAAGRLAPWFALAVSVVLI